MKIVYCKDSLKSAAGMERVLCTKANYLADILGYDVHIVLEEQHLPENLFFNFSPKIVIHSLDMNIPVRKPWQLFSRTKYEKEYEKKLSGLLENIKPDITVGMFGNEARFLYKLKDGSKKILEFHFTKYYLKYLGQSLIHDKYRIIRKLWLRTLLWHEEYLARKYEHIVLLTEKDKQLWGGGDKFEVIPNPVSFSSTSEKKADLDNHVILSAGRLVIPKGFDFLIQAFSLLHKDFPTWKLYIYGEGHDKDYFQDLINQLSLQDAVFLKKPVPDIENELIKSSLFVLPSLYEGFGLVLVEAMSYGIPCVAFDCECGPSDIIKDNVDGFLAATKNTRELAEKMKLLMENKDLRLQMGAEAKKNVKRFEIPVVMNLWSKYFKSGE